MSYKPDGTEASFYPLDRYGQPRVCAECGAAMQRFREHELPCATCIKGAGELYIIPVLKEPDEASTSLYPKIVELRFKRVGYYDSHFPKRRALFWWLSL